MHQSFTFASSAKDLSRKIVLGLPMLALGLSGQAFAEGSPWLPADSTTTLSASVISGSTDRFFVNETSQDLGGDLEATFIWLSLSYGYDDIWAFDVKTGYAESSFESNPIEQNEVTDTSFGVSYQFINEFEADNGFPTISGRLGYTVGGDYETNLIDAVGDGASGFDLSLLVGKTVSSEIAVFGDVTYRQRGENVADAVKYLLTAYYTTPISGLGLQLSAGGIRTDSSINIGDDDFGVDQFPQTDRDSDWLIGGANYGFSNGLSLGFSYAALISGKNVADTDIASFTLGYSF